MREKSLAYLRRPFGHLKERARRERDSEIHQSLRAREERLEKRKRVFFFSRREHEKYKCGIFLRVSKNTESVIFLRV
jgi:hypothetical protein